MRGHYNKGEGKGERNGERVGDFLKGIKEVISKEAGKKMKLIVMRNGEPYEIKIIIASIK